MRFSLKKAGADRVHPRNPSLTREDVVAAYRLILGREPENEEVVQTALHGYTRVEDLRAGFMRSPEFSAAVRSPEMVDRYPHDLNEGGRPIEVNCGPQATAELLAHVERTWSRLGKENPYWSVLTHDAFRIETFKKNQEAFWNSGERELVRLQHWLKRNQVALPASSTCLEYGCGTGRVTRWLARAFDSVVGCDISEAHLQHARQAIPEELRGRVTFLCVNDASTFDELPAFDLLFSIIVLQHNPPPVIAYMLDKLLARLRPGGIAYFQAPTFHPRYRFVVSEYVAGARDATAAMEMHVLPQRYIFQIAARNGCELVEVMPDNNVVDWDYISTTFLLRKIRG